MKNRNTVTSKHAELEKTKIIFQFTLMMIASVVAGICFSKFIGDNTLKGLTEDLLDNFSQVLPPQNTLYAFFARVVRISMPELICIIVIFVFSFSFINYVISDAVLLFMGFKFGINAALIKLATFTTIGIGNSLSFLLTRGILLPIVLAYTCKMALYSLDVRKFSSVTGRVVMNNKILLSMFSATMSVALSILLFNGLYCIFIYVF